jgi:hypothetical protein
MRARSLVVLFGTFLTLIAGLGSGQAQSATPAFTISASNVTMPASGMGAIPFTLTSVNGFAGSVVVGCSPASQPAGSILPQCGNGVVVVPYTLTANGTTTGTLNLIAYNPPCSGPCPIKLLSPPRQRGAVNLAEAGGLDRPRHRGAATLALAGVVLLGFGFRRRARQLRLMLLVVGIMAGLAGVSCGANHNTLTPGTFAYTVSAVEVTTNSPTVAVSTTVNVTVPAGITTNLPSNNP